MYEGLRDQVIADMQIVADRLGKNHDIIYPGMIETLDASDEAGKLFSNNHIDLLILPKEPIVLIILCIRHSTICRMIYLLFAMERPLRVKSTSIATIR